MARHRWVALGAAPMSNNQAREWAALPNEAPESVAAVSTGLNALFTDVVCVVCNEEFESALPECTGPLEDDGTSHLWTSFLTLSVTEEEAAAWCNPEGHFLPGHPRSVAVTCALCGQRADHPDEVCPERAFWVDGTEVNLEPEGFSDIIDAEALPEGTWVCAKPFGYDDRNKEHLDYGVPSFEGIGPLIEGQLEKRRSLLGHMVFAVDGVVVEPVSIRRISSAGEQT